MLMTQGDACACVRSCCVACCCIPGYALFMPSSCCFPSSSISLYSPPFVTRVVSSALHLFCSLCSSPPCSILSPLTSTLLSSRHTLTFVYNRKMLKELVDHMPVAETILELLPLPSVLDLALLNHFFFKVITPIVSITDI